MAEPDLEVLYRQAQSAIKGRDYVRAGELLRQILVIDENYKDTSRLLARLVHEKRRRWYNDVRIWGPVGGLVFIGLLIWFVPKLPLNALFVPATSPINTLTPTQTPRPTAAPTLTPSPLPLAWRRVSLGQEFERDNITAIVANPKDPDIIYVGTTSAGVYKSIDGGLSWQPMHNGLERVSVNSLVIDPDDPNVLYAGVLFKGVYKTTDGGKTWFSINIGIYGLGSEFVSIVAMDPQDSSHLFYVNGYGYLYESTNSGSFWRQHIYLFFTRIEALALHPQDAKTLFVVGDGSIYKSINGGSSWKLSGLNNYNIDVGKLWIDPIDGNSLYTETWEGSYFSLDGGNSWQVAPYDLYGCAFKEKMATCTTNQGIMRNAGDGSGWQIVSSIQLGQHSTLSSSPSLEATYYLGGNGLYISSDNGSSWKEHNNGLPNTYADLFLNPFANSKMMAITRNPLYLSDGQAFSSTDTAKTWTPFFPNFSNITHLSFDADANTIYIISDDGLVKSDDGKRWTKLTTPVRFDRVEANPKIAGLLYGIVQQSSNKTDIYISSDRGISWTLAPSPSIPDSSYSCRSFHLYFDSQGRLIYFHDGCSMWGSNDDGQSWYGCRDLQLLGSYQFMNSETRLVISPVDKNKLLHASRGSGIFASSDGCSSWIRSNKGLGNLYVNTLAVDPNNPDTVYAGTEGGAYISYNFGETWHEINDGLLGATVVYSIVVDKDSNVYAATPYGIFRLENK